MQQLGGHVTVESEVGQGTTFCVYLRQACPVRENAVTATGGMKRSSRGETILVVEDEQELRELVCGYLEAGGYQTFQAEDGERALELAKTHNGQIRLIVTDLAMPKMNGLKLAQEIQASVPDVPVLYMSGCPRRVLEQGIPPEWEGRFLSKPFGPDDLLAKVRSILNVDGF